MATPNPPSHPGRYLLVLVLLLAALGGWMAVSGNHAPKLGLDLQGGTQVILEPKAVPGSSGGVTQDSINQAVNIIRDRVNGLGVSEADVTTQGSGANAVIVVSVPGATRSDIVDAVGQTALLTFRPVLQAAAGSTVPTPTPTPASTKGGTATPTPTPTKTGGSTAKPSPTSTGNGGLMPRVAATTTPTPTASATPTPTASATPSPSGSATPSPGPTTITPAVLQQFQSLDCSTPEARKGTQAPDNEVYVACSRDGSEKYILAPVAVSGKNLSGASASLTTNGNAWVVNLSFDSKGTKQFAEVTTSLVGKTYPQNRFAIVLDGVVVSAPTVNEPIPGGQAEISGSFTQQEAQDLAKVLQYGALPLAFTIGERQTVSPTLGSDQLRAGLLAGALGLALVVVYLLLYYRALGLVAVASLAVAGALTYGLVVLLGQTISYTLTLAGVAGLIVAIGITADSFIVYFERIRDEEREGRSLRVAVEAGWIRARRTILTADAVSFIAALVLYFLSVGGVRGFAFSLGLTTIVDVFVVFVFTKPLITILAGNRWFNSGSSWTGLSKARMGIPPAPEPPDRRGRRRPSSSQPKGA